MKKGIRIFLTLFLVLTLVLAVSACGCSRKKKQTTAPDPTYLTVISEGKTDYSLVFAQDTDFSGLSSLASDLRTLAASLGISGMKMSGDSADAATLEILIGDTNRPESAAAMAKLAETAGDGYFQYAVGVIDGKVVLVADNQIAYDMYLYNYLVKTCVDSEAQTLKVVDNIFTVHKVTDDEHEQYLLELEEQAKAEAEAKRQEELNKLIEQVRDFKIADFGRVNDLPKNYDAPPIYPDADTHPRILVTPETLPTVRENLLHPENAAMYAEFIKASEVETDGELKKPTSATKGNMSYGTLMAIESKAFRYLIEGDEIYGYQAILAIKNYIRTLTVPAAADGNYCRAYGYTMYIAGCVFDWCHDLLTPADKMHIVAGVQTKLAPFFEMGFPPSKQGAVTGHGTEAQLYRDWLTFAIATYGTENGRYDSMYDYVVGRLFEDFRAAPEFYLQSGAHWQGSSYGPYRYYFLLYCNLLFNKMTNGEFDFYSDNLHDVAYFFLHTVRPDEKHFVMGDGQGSTLERAISAYFASALYGDAALKGFAKQHLGETAFSYIMNNNTAITPVMFLCINDPSVVPEENYRNSLPLVGYFGSPRGNLIARTAWDDENAAAVYMKIGEAYSANHEHRDAGHFMIYYKGILANDSGIYQTKYFSKHDYTYLKQTVAHNAMLVYNPALDNMHVLDTNSYYSGGQSKGEMSEYPNLDVWLSARTSHAAKILGTASAVNENGAGSSDDQYLWSYLAGDLTNAYDKETVDAYCRYMISIMTGDPENPMAFLVFDRVTSTDPTFKKTFLLHTMTQPTVDHDNDRAIVVSGEGKMHVQSLLGDVTYELIGGKKGETVDGKVNETDKQFWVGDRNFYAEDDPEYVIPDYLEPGWGRIEISPTAQELTSLMLTVMYVTDKSNEAAPVLATEIRGEGVVGAQLFGKTVIFPESEKLLTGAATFTAAGSGETEYFLAGLNPGLWKVSLNGAAPTGMIVDESGILTFKGAVGQVTLTPAFSTVEYHLNGGTEVTKLPTAYNFGDAFAFPTDLELYGSRFDGWYTTPTFDEGTKVTGVTAADTEPLVLYAKWIKVFDVLTFEINGGAFDGTKPSRELVRGEDYVLPNALLKENATFLGWYDNPNFNGSPITVLPANRPNGDVTVYARFQNVYYSNDFSGLDAPDNLWGGSFEIGDGWFLWKNPNGSSNFEITPDEPFSERSQTITFDLDLTKGTDVMNFLIRLRPAMGNVIDTELIKFVNGKLMLAEKDPKVLLDAADCNGVYRITLAMTCDNAGLAAGNNAPDGEKTTDEKYKSVISVSVFINGVFVDEAEISTYLTFGDGYKYSGTKISGGISQDVTFSSEMCTFQFYSAFAAELAANPNCPKSLRLDNLMISDGYLSVGGKYFLNLGELECDPSDTSYLDNREVVGFPTVKGGKDALEGWYLTPDFSGEPLTDIAKAPIGSVIYAKPSALVKHVIYDLSGGKITVDHETIFLKGEGSIALPEAVTHPFGEFVGWYDNPNFDGQPITSIPKNVDSDVTVYARFTKKYVTGEFDDGEDSMLPISYYSNLTVDEDGRLIWTHIEDVYNFNFLYDNFGGLTMPTVTFSFDLYIPEDGTVPMPFVVRLRPESGNRIDTPLLTMRDGRLTLDGAENGLLLNSAASTGWHRITLLLENDNAGLAAGLAAAEGTVTTGDEYQSNLKVTAFVDGKYAAEATRKTGLTFGRGFRYWDNKEGKQPFSSQTTILQFTTTITAADTQSIMLDNIYLWDGYLSAGGKYFVHTGENEIDPTDTSYLSGGEITKLPTLKGGAEATEGWYLTPDFSGEKITDLANLKAGTILYAKLAEGRKNIRYELADGWIIGNYECTFRPGEATLQLPETVGHRSGTFIGWYDNPNFEGDPITSVSLNVTADITVYARYTKKYVVADFESSSGNYSDTYKHLSVADGVLVWENKTASSNFLYDKFGGLAMPTVTFSFDLYIPEDGTAPMSFGIRLRPASGNVIDTYILSMSNGKLALAEGSANTTHDVILDSAVSTGWHRITLVLENDEAGAAAGKAAAQGTVTTGDEFKSNLTVTVFVDGKYAAELTQKTGLTFGQNFTYNNGVKAPFSSQATAVQFISHISAGDTNSVMLDNIFLADGYLSMGGRYFLVYDQGAPVGEEYTDGREILSVPTLGGEGVEFLGWYLSSDFSGEAVTDFDALPYGTVLYARFAD